MQYSTQQGKLIMPEYGRNIQHMIEYALTIEDREERTNFVYHIVDVMGRLFPELRDIHNFNHKLWDHVAIMSNFRLDIDYPYEVVTEKELLTRPDIIPYKNSKIKYMHYGRNLEKMIEIVSEYEEGETKEHLIRMIANQMKKCFLTWNKEVVNDRKILDDLRELSNGKLDIPDDFLVLLDTKQFLGNKRHTRNKKNR